MAETEQDLQQAATGIGYDPDQTWPDEPPVDLPDVDDADDHNDGEPEVEQ